MKRHHTVDIKGIIYDYFLTQKKSEGEKVFFVECPAAGISQEFYPEDVAEFLEDLPQWINEYQIEERKKRNTQILFRVRPQEKLEIERRTKKLGFSNVSEYLRERALA
jgi:hypothetical protein